MSAPSQNPIWNATLTFSSIIADHLSQLFLEIEMWDMVPHADFVYLGFSSVNINKALLDNRVIWLRIEDPSDNVAKMEFHNVIDRAVDELNYLQHDNRRSSSSDDVDAIGDTNSLLHPNHAWAGGPRRGSSQSDQGLNVNNEQPQLGKDYSRSLPGSRRSSFQSQGEAEAPEQSTSPFSTSYFTGRRRSSCTRRDPLEDYGKSTKGSRTKLNRTLSASSSEKRLSKSK